MILRRDARELSACSACLLAEPPHASMLVTLDSDLVLKHRTAQAAMAGVEPHPHSLRSSLTRPLLGQGEVWICGEGMSPTRRADERVATSISEAEPSPTSLRSASSPVKERAR